MGNKFSVIAPITHICENELTHLTLKSLTVVAALTLVSLDSFNQTLILLRFGHYDSIYCSTVEMHLEAALHLLCTLTVDTVDLFKYI